MSKEELNMAGQGKGIPDDVQEKWCFTLPSAISFRNYIIVNNARTMKNEID